MRLLDAVAQSRSPLRVAAAGKVWRLPSACDFAADVRGCPLRYVLTDSLLRLCVELAYSEGDVLSCLDLVRLPAEHMWIEWDEPAKRAALAQLVPGCAAWQEAPTLRKGVLLSPQAGQGRVVRRCSMRTFFTEGDDPRDALVMATEVNVDLDRCLPSDPLLSFLSGGTLVIRDSGDASIHAALQHAGFRLDPVWQRYYRETSTGIHPADLVHDCLGGVAMDVPVVLALLLMMSLEKGIATDRKPGHRHPGQTSRLTHVEIGCEAGVLTEPESCELPGSPYLCGTQPHPVRGHLVRRGDTVYWRRPHWRGHLRLGGVRAPFSARAARLYPAQTHGGHGDRLP